MFTICFAVWRWHRRCGRTGSGPSPLSAWSLEEIPEPQRTSVPEQLHQQCPEARCRWQVLVLDFFAPCNLGP